MQSNACDDSRQGLTMGLNQSSSALLRYSRAPPTQQGMHIVTPWVNHLFVQRHKGFGAFYTGPGVLLWSDHQLPFLWVLDGGTALFLDIPVPLQTKHKRKA